jgi:hypothetical protein
MSAPPVDELLDLDREFRRRFARGEHIVHTARGERRYTALYSESPLAHRLRRNRDWVILDHEVPGPNERWTVVTEFRGVLKGKRVVRGREVECFWFHRTARRRGRQAANN